MLGNCATGKLSTVSAPTSTMTMDITMATMGRLMKNFDMGHGSLSIRRSLVLGHEWLGIHAHPTAHSLNSFNHDFVSWIEPARDDPSVINPVAHSDRSNVNFIVGANHSNLVAALQFRHCALRNQQRPRLRPDDSADFGIAAGSQNIVWIGKEPGDSNRTGGLVHLAIGKIKLSLVGIRGAARQNQLKPQ